MIKNKTQRSFLLHVCLLMSFLVVSQPIWAAKLYVTENLRLRTEPSLEGAILATIKKGEQVEVLGIEGDFTHIEAPSGSKGWVASNFLSLDKPELPLISNKPNKIDTTNSTIKKQKSELNKLKKRLGEQEKNIKELQAQLALSQAEQQASAEKARSESDEKIAKIREILGIPLSEANSADNGKMSRFDFAALSGVHYSIAAGLLLIGFVIGLLWGDFIQRRRHGGYRI